MRWLESRIPLGVRALFSGAALAIGLLGTVPIAGRALIPLAAIAIIIEIPSARRYFLRKLARGQQRAKGSRARPGPRTSS